MISFCLSCLVLLSVANLYLIGAGEMNAGTQNGQIILGVIIAVQLLLQILGRTLDGRQKARDREQDRLDLEQQRRFEAEDRERKAEEVKQALDKAREQATKAAAEIAHQIEEKVDRNTQITETGFRETNDFKNRMEKITAAFATLADHVGTTEAKKVDEIQQTGEDTNERVRVIEEKAEAVLKEKEREGNAG